ncbi:MAG: minor capsid protein [Lachnospiraceae bacterium]|nr:minor capsid protein [Lachnospiraceae bacterium]
MADKNAYWQERRAQMMYEQMEIAENASNIIGKEYHKVAKYIEHQLSNNFEKAAKKFKVSDKDVLAIIKEAGVTSYQDIVRVAKNKGLTELVEYLEQPGRKYKFERLVEKLENVQNAVDSLKKTEELHTTEALKEVAESTYYKSIYEVQSHTGLGFSFNEWDDKLFEKLVTSKWSGKNYSSRIWANGDKLAETLKSEIIQGYVAGKTQDEMYKVIMDEFSTSAFNARRLVRTESCYVANEMEMQSYAECDIDRYIFIATLDLRTSELCASHDGKVYYVKDAVPGVNMPPMHPFCRSTTIEYLDEDTLKRMRRRARNPVTGKNEIVPAGMTYKDWYAKYVEGNEEAIAAANSAKNVTADSKQFDKYKERLGKKYTAGSLEEFQKIKYTNPEKYAIMKAQYKGTGYYDKAVAAEPEITKLVKQNAEQSGMKLIGLEYRVKDKDSYLDKIAREYKPGYHYEVKDTVRYTMIAEPKQFAEKTLKSMEKFGEDGNKVCQVKNLWLNKKNPYNGVNTFVQDSKGNKFEVQYHTADSFEAKQKAHKMYEQIRKGELSSIEMRDLSLEMKKIFDSVETPNGIERVKSYG